ARCGGELAVVEFPAIGNDDGVPVCAIVEALRADHGCTVRGVPVSGQAGSVSAGIPRGVSRPADELPDPGLGDEGDGKYHQHFAGDQRREGFGDLRVFSDAVYADLRVAGRYV